MAGYREVQLELTRVNRHLQAALRDVKTQQNSDWPFDEEEVEFLEDSLAKVRAPLEALIVAVRRVNEGGDA